jgi:hypothetical protein
MILTTSSRQTKQKPKCILKPQKSTNTVHRDYLQTMISKSNSGLYRTPTRPTWAPSSGATWLPFPLLRFGETPLQPQVALTSNWQSWPLRLLDSFSGSRTLSVKCSVVSSGAAWGRSALQYIETLRSGSGRGERRDPCGAFAGVHCLPFPQGACAPESLSFVLLR